jgi:hypothetical protein
LFLLETLQFTTHAPGRSLPDKIFAPQENYIVILLGRMAAAFSRLPAINKMKVETSKTDCTAMRHGLGPGHIQPSSPKQDDGKEPLIK